MAYLYVGDWVGTPRGEMNDGLGLRPTQFSDMGTSRGEPRYQWGCPYKVFKILKDPYNFSVFRYILHIVL